MADSCSNGGFAGIVKDVTEAIYPDMQNRQADIIARQNDVTGMYNSVKEDMEFTSLVAKSVMDAESNNILGRDTVSNILSKLYPNMGDAWIATDIGYDGQNVFVDIGNIVRYSGIAWINVGKLQGDVGNLFSDGRNKMDESYVPVDTLDISTKKYTDEQDNLIKEDHNVLSGEVDDLGVSVVTINMRMDSIAAAQTAGSIGFSTKALMDANLAYAAGTIAIVTNDATASNNTSYIKLLASGSGSWQKSSSDRVTAEEIKTLGAVISSDQYNNNLMIVGKEIEGTIFTGTYPTPYSFVMGTAGAFNYSGQVFDAVELNIAVGANSGHVTVQIRDVNFAVLATGQKFIKQNGKYFIPLDRVLDATVITGSVFFVSMQSTALNMGVANPSTSSLMNPLNDLADISLYPNKTLASSGVWTNAATPAYAGVPLAIMLNSQKHVIPRSVARVDENDEIRNGVVPYEVFLSDEGVFGNSSYSGGYLVGFYETIEAGGAFNQIECALHATIATDVEVRIFVRTSTAAFNTETAPNIHTETISAENFPNSAGISKINLSKVVLIPDNCVVFIMFLAKTAVKLVLSVYSIQNDGNTRGATMPYSATWAWGTFGFGSSVYYKTGINLLYVSPALFDYATKDALDALDMSIDDRLTAAGFDDNMIIVMSPDVYGLVGKEANIYLDNIIINDADDYNWGVNCTVGTMLNERYTVVPASNVVTPITVEMYKKGNESPFASQTATLHIAAATAGSGTTKKCLFIGDSLTYAGVYTNELLNLFDADVMNIELIGTAGTAPNLHEGISGWTVNSFYTTEESPFVYSGSFNFNQYMIDNSFSGLHYVFIHLGINDVGGEASDLNVNAKADTMLIQLEAMIASIKAHNASIRIGMMVTVPPSATQDAFAGTFQKRWRRKRNMIIWANRMISHFKARETELIDLVPVNLSLDTAHNMQVNAATPWNSRTTQTVVRQKDAVHPPVEGYYQMADVIYYFLKNKA